MNSVLRAAAVYLFLLVIFRLLGKRTLAEVTSFDFVLLREARVGIEDALAAALEAQGLERMEQIKCAVLEQDGRISVIPKQV